MEELIADLVAQEPMLLRVGELCAEALESDWLAGAVMGHPVWVSINSPARPRTSRR